MKGYNYMYNADEQWLPFIRLLTIVLPIKLWQFTEQRRMMVLNNIQTQYVVF